MNFNSALFIIVFLPIFWLTFYLLPKKVRFISVLFWSLIFYLNTGLLHFGLIIIIAIINYFGMLLFSKINKKFIPIILLIINIGSLVFFKYNENFLLPLGISFYAFNNISYIVDVLKKKIKAEKNFFYFLTYSVLFCHVTMGPITRYEVIRKNINNLNPSGDDIVNGFKRFIWGLIKKVLIADNLGLLFATLNSDTDYSFVLCILTLIVFGLQLYIDFSSYSDMAIGMGKMIGITYPENFDYPYLALSVSDFWRRWHMSLTNFFKEYIYFPLGGNRVKTFRHIINIMIVWLLTGIWHGSTVNFLLWGLYYGIILVLEKYFLGKILDKMPNFIKHIYVLLIVLIGYIFFSTNNFNDMCIFISKMFASSFYSSNILFYLKENIILLIFAVILCFRLPKKFEVLKKKNCINIICNTICVCLYILTIAYIVSGSFMPFLYNAF